MMLVLRLLIAMLVLGGCGPSLSEPAPTVEGHDGFEASDTADGSIGATGPNRLEDPAPTYRAIFGLEFDRNFLVVQKVVPNGHCLSLTMKPLSGGPGPGLSVEFRDAAYTEWSARELKVFSTHEGCFGPTLDPEGVAVKARGWLEWESELCSVGGFVEVDLSGSDYWPTSDTFDFSEVPVDLYLEGFCD